MDARDLYTLYMRGWRAGASGRGADVRATNHTAGREEYERGFSDGCRARTCAQVEASRRLGYAMNILRIQREGE